MPSVPLPFVISLLLCLILVRMMRQAEHKLGLFPLLIAMFAAQAMLSGLNWNVGWYPAHLVQPVVAALLPALCFVAFDQLRRNRPATYADILPHLVPAILVAILVALWRAPIDVVLFATYLGYGLGLLKIAKEGPEALSAVRIADEWTAHKALIAIAVVLVVTSFIDAIVSIDFLLGDGEQGRTVLTIASVLWLAIAGYAATVADNARPGDEGDALSEDFDHSPSEQRVPSDVTEDKAIANHIDTLMREQHLYRDPDLTLQRLARRSGIPARQISGALNRTYGRNVSQVVNEYRVSDAKQRLVTTRDQITAIMLESGFGTKSNFNREFLRVTGMTPSRYRSAGGENSAALGLPTNASIQ
ncbi:AraC family transcriptional regulator [Rhizobium sp. BK068]|nr:AraC family transcriptional regulator [Rhizobium sp. BK060]TCM67953.1 AraC family transcriptional regulator [Rhizobium sp. BK068]